VRQILAGLNFEDISITRKDNSEEIIKSWNIGRGTEHIVFSAYIRARKPADEQGMRGINSEVLKALGNISLEACKRRLAELSKGLAHPARVEIIRMLEIKPPERCVCGDIVNALPLAQSSVSQHLKVLKETGWVKSESEGPYVRYWIVDGIIDYYLDLMKRSLKQG
jgi:DNA-binding transcriptional ArsR family regulator